MDTLREKLHQKILGRKRTLKIALTINIHLKRKHKVFFDIIAHNKYFSFTLYNCIPYNTYEKSAHILSDCAHDITTKQKARALFLHMENAKQKSVFKVILEIKVQLHQTLERVKT